MTSVISFDLKVIINFDKFINIDSSHYLNKSNEFQNKKNHFLDKGMKNITTRVPFFIQSLIICEVKKFVSPFLSTVIFLKSSNRIGQIAFVGYYKQQPEREVKIL
jgi:hypothetical protein